MDDPNLLERNIDALFAIYDTDADGFITFDDMTMIWTRVCEELHLTGSPQATAVMESYASVWEQLRADCDTDGDGRISPEEFTVGASHFFLSSDPAHPGTSILGQA